MSTETIYLGNIAHVMEVFHGMQQAVADIYDRLAEGSITAEEGMAQFHAEAARVARIFKWQDAGYAPAEWMTPPRLAGKICAWCPDLDANDDPVLRVLERAVTRMAQFCHRVADGEAEEGVGPEAQAMIVDLARRFVGVEG